MNTFAIGSLPVHFSVAKLFNFRWQYTTVEDLYRYHSLNYEKLVGDKSGIESVRVNDQYRIEFQTKRVEAEIVVTVCNILELSNHYK